MLDYPHTEIVFIDDGSSDDTASVIKEAACKDKRVKYISFSRNFGHQCALRAGYCHASGDCVVCMDGDLQHPPELIPQMIGKWIEGYDVVNTRRNDRNAGCFKKTTSRLFYRLINWMSEVHIEEGSADFRLCDRKIVDVINSLPENPIFFRGMIQWMGFEQCYVDYTAADRTWGKTKYTMRKMFRFATMGITSFSVKPLHLSTLLGGLMAGFSIAYGFYSIIINLGGHEVVPGWTSVISIVAFVGGLQLIMLGVLGEYVGKLFIESKKRPGYIIKEKNVE